MLKARETREDRIEVREANHRMVNVLAILLANFRHKFYQFNDPCVHSAVTQFESQIIAVSELLRTISLAPPAEGAAIDVYLGHLSRALSRAILSPAHISCEIFSDEGLLPLDVCERLGFILVELVLNVSKYAFGDRNDGVVRIEMIRSIRQWRCTVSDNGIGMDGASSGTGLNIVDALVRSLNGRLVIRSGISGTCVCIVLPDQPTPYGHGSMQDAVSAAHLWAS
jgi:two-component sensor histidine kinase